jgi:bifunctional ADP-heptose synthase (sugar kinase/adenylyltransferase)
MLSIYCELFLNDCQDAGHVDFLEEAAKQGDYLIVGVHTDQVGPGSRLT